MQNRTYKIFYTALFKEELNDILRYITFELQNEYAAKTFLNNVSIAIIRRSKNPLAFQKYISSKDRKYPYYRIYVGNYIVYYVVIKNIMEVRRILYGRRNINGLV